jgi:hypothetical protein
MSIAQNFPAIAPSLNLSFALTKTLDQRITFARATTGTYYGTRTALAEQNLVLYSQQFELWGVALVTATANSTTAPDGTTTADTVTATASTGIHRVSQNAGTGGVTRTVSVFAKASTNNFIQFYFGSDGNAYANFNITAGAGALGTVGSAASASIIDVGNGWYRCVMTSSSPTADNSFAITLIDSATAARAQSWTTVGTEAVFLWGAQVEQRSTITAYTATTTQPITNYIPTLETAAAGVARFDHNPTTFESLGLLVEQQSTNLLTYSEQFDNASWSKQNSTITSNTIIAPDGTLTGDKLIEDTSTSTHQILTSPAVTVTAGTYCLTFYVKAAGRSIVRISDNANPTNTNAFFSLSGSGSVTSETPAGTGSITAVGNGWYRCAIKTVTAQLTVSPLVRLVDSGTNTVYTGNGFDGVYIWGAQLEALAFPTSYIATVASQVTRAADSAEMTGTNFSSWYNAAEGTIYTEAASVFPSASAGIYGLTANISVSSNAIVGKVHTDQKMRVIVNSTTVANLGSAAEVSNVFAKFAAVYKVNDFALSRNGAAVSVDNDGTIPVVSLLAIGNATSFNSYLNGTIKKIAYYPLRLSNTNLQALTS